MLTVVYKNSVRFIVLVLFQVLIVKNMEVGRFIVPFTYPLFLLWLPFEINNLLLLGIAFVTGLTVDLFYSTPGLHAGASVLIAFVRPRVYGLFSPREGYENGAEPTIGYMGTSWVLTSYGLLLFMLHSAVFFLEAYRFSEFFSTLLRAILSAAFSLAICILAQYLVLNKKKSGL